MPKHTSKKQFNTTVTNLGNIIMMMYINLLLLDSNLGLILALTITS